MGREGCICEVIGLGMAAKEACWSEPRADGVKICGLHKIPLESRVEVPLDWIAKNYDWFECPVSKVVFYFPQVG